MSTAPARSKDRRFRLPAHSAAALRRRASPTHDVSGLGLADATPATEKPVVRGRLSRHALAAAVAQASVDALVRASTYGVDLTEAANADLESYATFNEFFTRELKAGARPIASASGHDRRPGRRCPDRARRRRRRPPVSGEGTPLHARRAARRNGRRGRCARGRTLSSRSISRRTTIIACTRRSTARLTRTRYIPGARFSVSRATAAAIPRLFCRNERVVCWFETRARTDGRRVRRRAERLEHQHVRARRDRERRPQRVARAARRCRVSARRRDRPLQHGLDGRRAVRRAARSRLRPALADGLAVRMGQALGAFAPD